MELKKEVSGNTIIRKIFHHKRSPKKRRHLRDYFRLSKAGVITGAADNDPSGIATYSQVGAVTRFSQLWLIFFTIPMLIVIEEMSARIGVVTKKGLNHTIKNHFGIKVALFSALIIIICNTVTIGADIAGMAAASGLLTGIPWGYFIIPITAVIAYTLMKENFKVVSRFLLLLTPVLLLYIIIPFVMEKSPDWSLVITETFLPHVEFSTTYLLVAIGLLGTTISPYLIFWQTTEEVEDKKTVKELKNESWGVGWGMVYCNLVFYFIVLSAAVLFAFSGGGTLIETAADVAAVAKAEPLAGNLFFYLFLFGILGSGFLAVPILASSSAYVIADALGWKEGLDKKVWQARGFYLIITFSLIGGALMTLLGISPMMMLFYSQVLQGILVPFLLVLLLLISNNKDIMGKHTNDRKSNIIGWSTVALMGFFVLAIIFQFISSRFFV